MSKTKDQSYECTCEILDPISSYMSTQANVVSVKTDYHVAPIHVHLVTWEIFPKSRADCISQKGKKNKTDSFSFLVSNRSTEVSHVWRSPERKLSSQRKLRFPPTKGGTRIAKIQIVQRLNRGASRSAWLDRETRFLEAVGSAVKFHARRSPQRNFIHQQQ